jgi:hypothetical protein
MDLKEYLIDQHQQATVNEMFLLPILTVGLFSGIARLFGWFSKNKRKEWDDDIKDKLGDKRDDLGDTASLFGGSKSSKKDDGKEVKEVKPISELSEDKQVDEIVKTQVLMKKMMEGKEGPEVDHAKMLLNQTNACLYDENGNLRSPEDRKKFAEEMNGGNDVSEIFKNDFDKIAKNLSKEQNSSFKDQLDFSKITSKEIEKQKEDNKKSAIQIHKDIAKAHKENPNDSPIVNFYKASGAPDSIVNDIKKIVNIANATDKANEDKENALNEKEKRDKEINDKASKKEIGEEEKDKQLKQSQEEYDKKIKEIDDELERIIKDNKEEKTETNKLSNEDIEKIQNEIGELDDEKDKDKIKELEDKLKQAAKAAGKDEDSFLVKTETGSDGKQYKKMTGPRGGKYYKVKPKDGSWSKEWINGEPPKNESFVDLISYMKTIFE